MHYVAVIAARNESNLQPLIDSVNKQSIKPSCIVVVNDGDDPITLDNCVIIDSNQPRSKTRGINQSTALMMGVEKATELNPGWDYLLKLDADVEIPLNYVEEMILFMEQNYWCGISSGWNNNMGKSQQMHRPSDAAKVFTRECWNTIEGYTITNAFDTHATLNARFNGWQPEINRMITFRETRSNVKVTYRRWVESGRTRARWGFPVWHTFLAALKNLTNGKPIIVGPLAMVASHIFTGVDEPLFPRDWCRKYAVWETRNILGGKR